MEEPPGRPGRAGRLTRPALSHVTRTDDHRIDAFYAEMMKNKASNNLNVGLPNGNVDMNFFNPDLSKSIDVVKRMDYIASR